MPVHKVKGGYRWGATGKVYKSKAAAARQGRAIYASMGRARRAASGRRARNAPRRAGRRRA